MTTLESEADFERLANSYYAFGGVSAALVIPIVAYSIVTCARGSRRKDPGRAAMGWLIAMFVFAALAYFFTAVNYIVLGYATHPSTSYGAPVLLRTSMYGVGAVGRFFRRAAELSCMVILAELGNGFLYALTHERTTKQKAIRTVAILAFIVLMIMNIVDVVYGGVIWARVNLGYSSGGSYSTNMMPLYNMITAYYFLLLFIHIALMVQAALVKRTYRKQTSSSNTVTLYLVAAVLMAFPRALWSVISFSAAILNHGRSEISADVETPVSIVFDVILLFIVLVLLSTIATRKMNGLWTTVQPWMHVAPPAGGAPGYGPPPPQQGYPPNGGAPVYYMPQQGQMQQMPPQQMYASPPPNGGMYEVPGTNAPERHMLSAGPDGVPHHPPPVQQPAYTHEMKA